MSFLQGFLVKRRETGDVNLTTILARHARRRVPEAICGLLPNPLIESRYMTSITTLEATGTPAITDSPVVSTTKAKPAFGILGFLSTSHMVNDMMQSLILAMYPILKGDFSLSFTQIGLISLTYQFTASLLQPLIGLLTDRKPQPYWLPLGMLSTLVGLILLAFAPSYAVLLLASASLASGPPSSILNRRVLPVSRPGEGTASRSRYSRSAATWGAHWGHFSLQLSSCPLASTALRGSGLRRYSAWSCFCG